MSFALEVALAYLRARPSRLVSAVSLLAVAGIALGVASLVVAMGLLSGYRDEIREKLIGANAEIVLYPLGPTGADEIGAVRRRLAALPAVRATAPVVYQTGLASSRAVPDGVDAVVKGVDFAEEARVSPAISTAVVGGEGSAAAFAAAPGGRPGVSVGVELARRLAVGIGDEVALAVPDASGEGSRFVPRTGVFRVARIFRTNFAEYDAGWVFCDRTVLRALARSPVEANVVEVRLDRRAETGAALAAIRAAAGKAFSVADTLSLNGGLFSLLRVQQTTLFLLIGLIVAVSTFNVVATLVMTVEEKRRDIGVLSALGAEPRFLRGVFVRVGGLLGAAGVVSGIAFGALVCWVVTTFRLLRFPPEVAEIYFVSSIPFRVRAIDLAAILAFSASAIFFAAWLPARRAVRVDVAEALRYE